MHILISFYAFILHIKTLQSAALQLCNSASCLFCKPRARAGEAPRALEVEGWTRGCTRQVNLSFHLEHYTHSLSLRSVSENKQSQTRLLTQLKCEEVEDSVLNTSEDNITYEPAGATSQRAADDGFRRKIQVELFTNSSRTRTDMRLIHEQDPSHWHAPCSTVRKATYISAL